MIADNNDLLKDVFVIIPTLNEEKAIGKVLDELLSIGLSKDQILIVDGHSTDKTREIAINKGVKVILQKGKGKADAIFTALEHVNRSYVMIMDGDYTYPAGHIHDLLRKAYEDKCDEVIGARVWGRSNIPLINRIGNKLLTFMFNMLFGTKLKDVLSGMYLVKYDILREITWEMKGFSAEVEIAAHTASTGKICECPISYRKRIGEKKLKIIHGLSIGRDIIRLVWRYNPAFFIFMIGALLLIPGLGLGAWVAYHYFFTGIKYYVKGLVALSLALVGFISLILAILSLYLKR